MKGLMPCAFVPKNGLMPYVMFPHGRPDDALDVYFCIYDSHYRAYIAVYGITSDNGFHVSIRSISLSRWGVIGELAFLSTRRPSRAPGEISPPIAGQFNSRAVVISIKANLGDFHERGPSGDASRSARELLG